MLKLDNLPEWRKIKVTFHVGMSIDKIVAV